MDNFNIFFVNEKYLTIKKENKSIKECKECNEDFWLEIQKTTNIVNKLREEVIVIWKENQTDIPIFKFD